MIETGTMATHAIARTRFTHRQRRAERHVGGVLRRGELNGMKAAGAVSATWSFSVVTLLHLSASRSRRRVRRVRRGYRVGTVATDSPRRPQDEVADESTERVSVSLPLDVVAAQAARHALRLFRTRISEQTASALGLIATELVTNAYRHGGQAGTVDLSAHLTDEHVHLAVKSPRGDTKPTIRGGTEQGGWGLRLVDSIADDWGIDDDDDTGCVTVWTRIPRQL
jgi:serine/threonine-protein kinase RsbW